LKLEATPNVLDDSWEDSDDNATFTLYLAYFHEKNQLNDSHISQMCVHFIIASRVTKTCMICSSCLVSEVRGRISKLGPKVKKLLPRIPVASITTCYLQLITSNPQVQETLTLVIKSLMLVYIPFSINWKVIQNPTSDIDIQTRTNMKSVAIWLAMKTYVVSRTQKSPYNRCLSPTQTLTTRFRIPRC